MIRRASRDPGRDFTMNGNAIFSDLLYLLNLVIRNNIVIYVLQTSFCWKKDSEESIASIFSKKKWYFRHEWISSQDVFESMLRFHCKNWSCEDNEADAKSFFRVEIFFFFNRKVIEHIVEKMDVVVWSTEAELFLSGSREERVWSSKLGMRIVSSLWIFFFQSWPLFRRRLASRRQTLQAGHFFSRSLLKVDERESGELFGELFWNDVAYFFPMINFCNLIVERRRNGNDIFYLRKRWRSRVCPLASTLTFPGRR